MNESGPSELFLKILNLTFCGCSLTIVFYRRIFNLKMHNFLLENHYMLNARQPFCWQMTSTKVPNPLLPYPYVVDHLTFVGEAGMGDLVWVRMFFPNLFSRHIEGKIFFRTSLAIFSFPVQDIICPRYVLASFSHWKLICRTLFFSDITHNLLKSQIVGP